MKRIFAKVMLLSNRLPAQCHKKHATSTCFLNSAAIPAGSFRLRRAPCGELHPNPEYQAHYTCVLFLFPSPLFLNFFSLSINPFIDLYTQWKIITVNLSCNYNVL